MVGRLGDSDPTTLLSGYKLRWCQKCREAGGCRRPVSEMVVPENGVSFPCCAETGRPEPLGSGPGEVFASRTAVRVDPQTALVLRSLDPCVRPLVPWIRLSRAP